MLAPLWRESSCASAKCRARRMSCRVTRRRIISQIVQILNTNVDTGNVQQRNKIGGANPVKQTGVVVHKCKSKMVNNLRHAETQVLGGYNR